MPNGDKIVSGRQLQSNPRISSRAAVIITGQLSRLAVGSEQGQENIGRAFRFDGIRARVKDLELVEVTFALGGYGSIERRVAHTQLRHIDASRCLHVNAVAAGRIGAEQRMIFVTGTLLECK